MTEEVIVIGAGQAAASFAAKFRSLNQEAKLTIIGDEPSYPYQRPPLSKKYLAGEMDAERLLLRPHSWYGENAVEVLTDTRVTKIDPDAKALTLADGSARLFDKLLIATGSRPRKLPSEITKDAPNLYAVRNLADVDAMRAEFAEGRKLVVIGGGYIGLEAAAIARKFGVEVVLVEASPRILGRVACTQTADFIRNAHHNEGTTIVENIGIEGFSFAHERISGVRLADGRELPADFVIVGIGIETNSELAAEAGLDVDQGILVNEFCQTSHPDIYAAGDCARFDYNGALIRLESVQNAIDQAENAALSIAGQAEAYVPKPWFWSDQYDFSLQIAGLNLGYDDVVIRPSENEGSATFWYYRGAQLISVDAINEARAYMIGKRVIESGRNIPKDQAGDPSVELKQFMKG